MIIFLTRFLDALNKNMSSSLHNYVVLSLLGLTELTGVSLLARFLWTGLDIPQGPLTLLEYELMGLLASIGVVGGLHTVKAIKGVESGSQPVPPPPPAQPEPKPDS